MTAAVPEAGALAHVVMHHTGEVPVDPGFTWTAAGAWATCLCFLYLIIRNVGPWKKQTTDAETALRTELRGDIAKLERRLDKTERLLESERRQHYIEMRRLEARYSAQRSLDRHKFRNSQACLDGLLRILELSPEKAGEAARRARMEQVEHRRTESDEATAIKAAEILAAEVAGREFDSGSPRELGHEDDTTEEITT